MEKFSFFHTQLQQKKCSNYCWNDINDLVESKKGEEKSLLVKNNQYRHIQLSMASSYTILYVFV